MKTIQQKLKLDRLERVHKNTRALIKTPLCMSGTLKVNGKVLHCFNSTPMPTRKGEVKISRAFAHTSDSPFSLNDVIELTIEAL